MADKNVSISVSEDSSVSGVIAALAVLSSSSPTKLSANSKAEILLDRCLDELLAVHPESKEPKAKEE
ncbi:MAG: hypothetical protein QME60_01360 [Verrucomicrobiota bacterium]|nr:hypothetical protein [Verrucomicrobiota bacterium]